MQKRSGVKSLHKRENVYGNEPSGRRLGGSFYPSKQQWPPLLGGDIQQSLLVIYTYAKKLGGPYWVNDASYRDRLTTHLQIGKEMLYLTKQDCLRVGLMADEIFHVTENAFLLHGRKELDMPPRTGLPLKNHTYLYAMSAHVPSAFACGIKWGSVFGPYHETFPWLQTPALLMLNDPETGCPLAIMDGTWLAEAKEPAITLVGMKHLVQSSSESLGIIGCDRHIGEYAKQILHQLPGWKKIYVYDPCVPTAHHYLAEQQLHLPSEIILCRSLEEVVKQSEVIVSTSAHFGGTDPQIRDEWIGKGQTILHTSGHLYPFYEDRTIKRADKFIVDSIDHYDLLIDSGPYPHNVPSIYAEIGDIAAGVKKGREHPDELIIQYHFGIAAVDMMLARTILERALQLGVGQKLSF